MKFEDLDADTQGIIDSMVHNTGKSREESILALVEFGMIAMMASVCPQKQDKIMNHVYHAVNNDEALRATAQRYSDYWNLNI